MRHQGSLSIAKDVINVWNNLHRIIATKDDEQISRSLIEDIDIALQEVLSRHGYHRITTAAGDRFDPKYHEAIVSTDGETDGVDVIEKVLIEGFRV